jgi:hypothetical protein
VRRCGAGRGTTRNWSRIDVVTLNTERNSVMKKHLTGVNAQQLVA